MNDQIQEVMNRLDPDIFECTSCKQFVHKNKCMIVEHSSPPSWLVNKITYTCHICMTYIPQDPDSNGNAVVYENDPERKT